MRSRTACCAVEQCRKRVEGIGRDLLEEIIERSEQKWHPNNTYLHVVSANTRARKLYESLGFRVVASLPQWFEYKRQYLDEFVLILDKKRFQQSKQSS